MQYTVYILKGEKGNLYKGMTCDLKRRLKEHKAGGTKTTARMNKIDLVYTEEFATLSEARKREIYFKTATGRRFIKNKLNIGL